MIISDVLPVMVDDALLSSHPIIVNVSTPAEITSVFDSISYSKVSRENCTQSSFSTNEEKITFSTYSGSFHPEDAGRLDG